jgi:hypothetical protein
MRRPKWLGGKPKSAPVHPELPAPTGPLREFVYLDEVSVISLVASRRGAVPEAVTRSESARDTADLNSKIAVNAGVLKSDVGSKLGSETTKGVTTVAKSIVQSTFKDLHEIEADRLTLKAPPPDAEQPKAGSLDDLIRLAGTSRGQGWVIAPSSLRRGDPIEVEVELSADPLFRLRTRSPRGWCSWTTWATSPVSGITSWLRSSDSARSSSARCRAWSHCRAGSSTTRS